MPGPLPSPLQTLIDVDKWHLRQILGQVPHGLTRFLRRLLRRVLEGAAAQPGAGADHGAAGEQAPLVAQVWMLALVPFVCVILPQVMRFLSRWRLDEVS